ncbi:unnamed protein product (macronuclear) [Paramecium tetraurelia]|uniref:Transmembrane protein n=1 Tax=Paramecium tetraurelia TaxID=5888 RepID=A0BNA6_PARTE|nr:uncharacterized protein GSPATT00030661001 [Paramecium tetraurelia]CAK60023.1 unnamed protein product [Paramecium tetraurelia]|eukprot:XP_001427421.1 hypothetical protein (macronuclear) [Paramecium tetraurelia strain d4-2]
MQIYLIVVLIFQLWYKVIAETDSSQTSQTQCMDAECTYCKAHHFVFQLPQDNDEILNERSRICVECPFQSFMENEENLYCGDCLDNSRTWNVNRVCSYDYLTYSTINSVYHQKERSSAELFYVVESEPGKIVQYSTIICNGCDHFCKEKSQKCFLVPKEYQNDINYMYVSCKEGYEFDELRQLCISCPQNCLSCDQNTCLICNQGFSKLILRESANSKTTKVFCIPCFEQCKTCYFGKNGIDLNVDSWDAYNKKEGLLLKDFLENQTQYFENLYIAFQIAQRCEQCQSLTQIKFIPSLNRRSCVQCGIQCIRCEYYSYWLSNKELINPSKNRKQIIEPQNEKETQELLESQYVLRCRECLVYNQMFNAIGTSCSDCKINDCVLCHKTESQSQSKVPFSTLSINFEVQPQEDIFIEKCVLCKDGFYLTETGICLIFDSQNYPGPGCLTFERSYDLKHCRKCQQGYILSFDSKSQIWYCVTGCDQMLQDSQCESCVQQGDQYRCQICKVGYYVDTLTNKCKPCSLDGYCMKCYTLTLNIVHHPECFSAQYYQDSQSNTVLGPFCYQCIPDDDDVKGRGHFLNEDLRKCEKGGDKCETFLARGEKGFCDQCLNKNSRSSSSDGNNCIDCPNNTIGCRERTEEEIERQNRFYEPSNELKIYSTLSFKCTIGLDQMETKICRCLSEQKKNREISIDVRADCSEEQQINNDKVWQINTLFQEQNNGQSTNNQFQKPLSKNVTIILENKASLSNTQDYISNITKFYEDLNIRAVYKISINLIFSSSNPSCFFQKDTYFSTDLKKMVFSAESIELNIKVENDNAINWYLQNNIYFEYFSKVTISGINMMPAVDCDLYPYIKKLQKPFSLQFIKNDGLIVRLERVQIINQAAYTHYLNPKLYTTPYSQMSLLNKKYTPFYFIFTNVYDLQLNQVMIQSLNYLHLKDTNFTFNLFGFNYEPNIPLPYFHLNIDDVMFSDLGIEDQALFDLEFINLTQQSQINFQVLVQQVSFNDVYFLNGAGFISPKFNDTLNGLIRINNLFVNNTKFNHSRGIINFNNMQQIYVINFTLVNSFVNHTFLFHITTIQMAKCYVYNTQFTSKGRMLQTQHELSKISKPNHQRLKLVLEEITFEKVICLTPQCLILISAIKNDYDIPVNITMKNIEINQIQTEGFDLKILNAATSAAIKIEKSYIVYVQDFISKENSNLSILYVDMVWNSYFYDIRCHQIQNLQIRNNYCLFVNNLYKSVKIKNIELLNLHAQDASFIGISSWNNLIYNTSTLNSVESISLEQIIVKYCTVSTTQPSIPSSAIIIQSNQKQNVQLTQMQFQQNKHFLLIQGSLTPSNPTLIMQSSLGNLLLTNSKWGYNSAQGSGAVLHLESGISTIRNVSMFNNNDPYSRGVLFGDQQNEGGHLKIVSFQTTVDNCTFFNSTAKFGGSIFIKSLKEGQILIKNTLIQASSTQLDSTIGSKGGCLYIDSKESKLNMTIIDTNFEDCFSRQEGGAIYVLSFQSQQQILIQETTFSNCFALSGAIFKVIYDKNQKQTQQTRMENIYIQAIQSRQEEFFDSLGLLKQIEKYIFLIRTSAIEQDFGEIILINVNSQDLQYQGLLSVKYSSLIKLQSIIVQNYILTYNPLIEIIEPILNPVHIEEIKFANITSISLESVKCNTQKLSMTCKILQVRADFPQIKIQPSLMKIDSIMPSTFLTLRGVLINKIHCTECIDGLVQITRVYNRLLVQSVFIDQCRCTDTLTAYYGCFAISCEPHIKMQTAQDQIHNLKIQTNLTREAIINYTGIVPSEDLFSIQEQSQRLLETEQNFQYVIPNPTYKSHVFVLSLFTENNTCFHGCGISIYELTTNITNSYCTQNEALGKGGFIYFESGFQQRINVANISCYDNRASIGGCIALQGVDINDVAKTGSQIGRNVATLFGNNINQFPQNLALYINGTLYQIPTPILFQSGYTLDTYQNQIIQIHFLDQDQHIVKHQIYSSLNIYTDTQNEQASNNSCEISSTSTNKTRSFNNELQGFDLSKLTICQNPNLNKIRNLTFTSSHIKQPIYIDDYPYTFVKYKQMNLQLIVKFQPIFCRLGEYYNEFGDICIKCPLNFYQLQLNSSTCKEKDYITMKEAHGFQIYLFEDYWRPKINNDQVESCRRKKCKGGLQVGNELCTEGSIGALCEECDIHMIFWEQSYYKDWKSYCSSCENISIRVETGFVILTQFLIILSLGWISDVSKERNILLNFKRTLGHSYIVEKQQITPQVFLIIICHMQFISIMKFSNMENPLLSFFIAFNSITMPAQSLKVHLQCLLEDDLYIRLIYSFVFVIGGCLLTLMISIIQQFNQKKKKLICYKFRFSVQNFLILVFIYVQPSFLIELVQLLYYRAISGSKYIYANLSYLFKDNYDSKQNFVIIFLILITVTPILVCIYFYFAIYRTKKYKKTRVLINWGIMYSFYGKRALLYEFIFRQIKLLIFVLISFNEKIYSMLPLVFIIVLRKTIQNFFNVQKTYPYTSKQNNKWESISDFVSFTSYILSSFLFNQNWSSINQAAIISLYIINLAFFAIFLHFLLVKYYIKIKMLLKRRGYGLQYQIIEDGEQEQEQVSNNIEKKKKNIKKIIEESIEIWKEDKTKKFKLISKQIQYTRIL